MLNAKKERELAYVVTIDDIEPIAGADRVELALIGGWRVMVRKGQFKVGDPAIYFEIDSKVPETEEYKFLEPKHYKVKSQKYFKGTILSQGLLMAAEDFGWEIGFAQFAGDVAYIVDDKGVQHIAGDVDNGSMFLTKQLGITYAVTEDNKRKASSSDKYKKMAQRNGTLFSHQPFRWLMKRTWGKKLLFLFFGKKKDKKNGWPAWVVKTDEERIQNIPWILDYTEPWIVTEKIDGTSTTFTMRRKKFGKNEYYVCSRNVVMDTPDRSCFYDSNVYIEMSEKYHMEDVLKSLLDENPEAEWVTIQGETYGSHIQKRDYSMIEGGHDLAVFNLIFSNTGRLGTVEMKEILDKYNVPCVPILNTDYYTPDTVDEMLGDAGGESKVDGLPREGIVLRSKDGSKSFKAVDNEFILKYHG